MGSGIRHGFRRLKEGFLNGPPWFVLPARRTKQAYQSPTLLCAAWGYALLDRVLTPQGRLFGIVYLAVTLYASILTRSPAVILFFILSGVIFFNLFSILLFFPRLKLERRVPSRVTCGCDFEIQYTIRNRSAFQPCFDIVPDATMMMKELKAQDSTFYRMTLFPKQEGRIRRKYRILKRGIYHLPCPLAETAFPFQILKISRMERVRQSIICHPAFVPLRTLALPDGSAGNNESVNTVSSVGESMDFYGCREYRTGDDPRKIHWVASAKRAEFVVKEFQEEKLSRASILLDNSLAGFKETPRTLFRKLLSLKPVTLSVNDAPFEAAVSLTASIATSLSGRDFIVDFFAAGSEIHHFRTGRNHMNREAFLDILASLGSTTRENRFDKITQDAISTIASTGAVFMILLSIDEESRKLYQTLINTGTPVRVFLISDHPGPLWAETIPAADILQGKAREL